MSSRTSQIASQISTHLRCDNCGIFVDEMRWFQCQWCKAFDLCIECARTPYEKLPRPILNKHQEQHPNTPMAGDCLRSVSIKQAEKEDLEAPLNRKELEYQRIIKQQEIENDYEMSIIMNKIAENNLLMDDAVKSLIVNYYLTANQRKIRVISLEGGVIRGYMPIQILGELIVRKHLPNMAEFNMNDSEHRLSFQEGQEKFTQHFDYFVGTSTGGLIAFCLAVNYNMLDMKDIYSNASHYFKRNHFGPWFCSKYDPSRIHGKIDEIIDQITFPIYGKISSKHATLLDLRNLLNPDDPIDDKQVKFKVDQHGNSYKCVDDMNSKATSDISNDKVDFRAVKREKILLITAYNVTQNEVMIFNTSDINHWGYRIADVLKSTMAAPIYFLPYQVYRGERMNGHFLPGNTSECFIDGGVFTDDPELAALWAIGMQQKKVTNYHLLCVGTGCHTATPPPSTWGGYLELTCNKALLTNLLLNVKQNFREMIIQTLWKFPDIKRMKLNYKFVKETTLDDPDFVWVFDKEWLELQNEEDFKAFLYFYDEYIKHNV